MNLEYEVRRYLQENDYKPNYLLRAQNYLNGFLVHLPDYNSKMMKDFQKIMSNYCECGYFKAEQGIADLPNYRLTLKGYNNLIM